jgi:nucleotide-binding universal stress UspA family protein
MGTGRLPATPRPIRCDRYDAWCAAIECANAAVSDDAEQVPRAPAAPAHPVVAGYDGSTASRRALAWATGLARRTGRPLLVAYISPVPISYDPGTVAVPVAEREADVLAWLRTELADTLPAATPAGLDVHVAACIGDAARELARLADEHQADALVLGAPEHRLHHLVGSVPVWMARHAHCPVVIVP